MNKDTESDNTPAPDTDKPVVEQAEPAEGTPAAAASTNKPAPAASDTPADRAEAGASNASPEAPEPEKPEPNLRRKPNPLAMPVRLRVVGEARPVADRAGQIAC